MKDVDYQGYAALLEQELIPALGCTEPISIALAAAKARALLGVMPETAAVYCSGNVVKNVHSVTVPNSGGQKGIAVAAALGLAGGDPDLGLQVLTPVDDDARRRANELVERGVITCHLLEDVDNLYISVRLSGQGRTARADIGHRHTRFVRLEQNGEVLLCHEDAAGEESQDLDGIKAGLTVEGIVTFADSVPLELVRDVLEQQIQMNTAISDYGLNNPCGAQVGRTLLSSCGNDVRTRARARAAAASDARMSGCTMPVTINSGSGNQGATVSLPVIEYAAALGADREQLYRALTVSNLVAIHQKRYIGNLSAFCGAVSAACGAGAGITYLHGGTLQQISGTITNTLANVGGILCDGAKASCAAKIATSVDAAILGHAMSMAGLVFSPGDGIVRSGVEQTMERTGYIARHGMQPADTDILAILLEDVGTKDQECVF